MKLLVLSTSNNVIDGYQKPLEDSLIKHGYDYEFFLYGFVFGEQYKTIKIWCDQYKGDATHVLYTDQWDTLALGPPEEVLAKFKRLDCKILISAEKAYFPNNGESHLYPESPTPWKYVNGGGCLFEIEFFKKICNEHPFPEPMMDPYWLRDIFLAHPNEIKLDYKCEIFQCLAHSEPDKEWEKTTISTFTKTKCYNGEQIRIQNVATKTYPIFFHGNGRTDMQWVKEIALQQPNI